ncbi:hypothetical protein [Parabacteroides pacaensis]|uniref:hypothetical protein n=1 Tax=Parabacteroides pacaensis TaxID=2086575 RepID=UPI000D0E4147|nr:hypothetical protein [Parabacteroides pacaensis]
MKATKHINSKGLPKGAFVYSIKKDGTRYAKPTFYEFAGAERSALEIIERLKKYNPNSNFEIADNQDELLTNY